MLDEWLVYTRGSSQYINHIYGFAVREDSDFEWKKEYEDGIWFLYFRPKSKIPDFMNIKF